MDSLEELFSPSVWNIMPSRSWTSCAMKTSSGKIENLSASSSFSTLWSYFWVFLVMCLNSHASACYVFEYLVRLFWQFYVTNNWWDRWLGRDLGESLGDLKHSFVPIWRCVWIVFSHLLWRYSRVPSTRTVPYLFVYIFKNQQDTSVQLIRRRKKILNESIYSRVRKGDFLSDVFWYEVRAKFNQMKISSCSRLSKKYTVMTILSDLGVHKRSCQYGKCGSDSKIL